MKLSIVMPFYKRSLLFRLALEQNHEKLSHPLCEVVLVLDEPTEQAQVLEIVQRFPKVNWKVLMNPNDHNWRTPAKAVNVGIRYASGEYVLIVSPESMFGSDVPAVLLAALANKNSFAIGRVKWASLLTVKMRGVEALFQNRDALFYGSLCAKREDLVAIRGYNESISDWGGDDDNLRRRLQLRGVSPIRIPAAKVIHLTDETYTYRSNRKSSEEMEALMFPRSPQVNNENWGTDFNQMIYTNV